MARSSPGKYDSLSKLVTQTLMLAIVSCIVAGLVTYVVSLGLNHSGAINNVTVKQNQLQILFMVYVITFIFAMIVVKSTLAINATNFGSKWLLCEMVI